MLTTAVIAIAVLLLVASSSTTLLVRDVAEGRLRQRVGEVSAAPRQTDPTTIAVRPVIIRSANQRSEYLQRFMHLLRFNPDIPLQNVIAWKLVFAISAGMALVGFLYGRALVGWPLAGLLFPAEALLVARLIFGWERSRFQKALLEQIPDVMGLICRAVGAGIPLSEAIRSVARESPSPSREEFIRVVNEVGVGQPLEDALWKLYERVELPEYSFFAVTIGLQSQTGGSLVETLQNLQDIVRKRVALSKRGKALAAEARTSAIILGVLPFVMCGILYFIRPGFLEFFANTPSGQRLALIACGLMGTGIFVMRQLIRRSLAP
ncbi:MAG TPA: type II secretion system F family protein [Acetobacteraceae bacterium]|nr:type II secretion system F family protein [Acetobacteraceae bacterium]